MWKHVGRGKASNGPPIVAVEFARTPIDNEANRLADEQGRVRRWATAALVILTALNFVNYIDRSVLFAVQPLVQHEFPGSDARFGLLTTAFFFCYMATAPLVGWLATRAGTIYHQRGSAHSLGAVMERVVARLREGMAVVAGTLNMGPSGDAIVVVVTARRAGN